MSRKTGLTLVELMVVIIIISILVGLLLPALMKARDSARRTLCQNNLHQLALAMRGYRAAYNHLPNPASPNSVGGWSVALLGFLEQTAWEDELMKNPTINPVAIPPLASRRPPIMSCPFGYDGDSTIAKIPAANYVLVYTMDSGKKHWQIGDAPVSFRGPWVTGPEMEYSVWSTQVGPHDGGFYIADSDGSVEFFAGQSK